MMKKAVLIILAFASLAIIGCSKKEGAAAAPAKPVTIIIGTLYGPTHPVEKAVVDVFKADIESKSGGRLLVDYQGNGVLGNEQGLWDQVMGGSIQVALQGTGSFQKMWPQAYISDWPFLYRDLQHAKKWWGSAEVDSLNASFHQTIPQVYMLAWGPNSARTFTSNKKLTSVDDFKGQKFRMPGNPIHVGIVENLGASAQVIPLNELFSALETGVVDGQDNGLTTVISNHFEEVQKYVYETNHITATLEFVANAAFLDGLPADLQKIVKDAAVRTMQVAWDNYIGSVDSDRAYLVGKGVTVTPCSAADQDLIKTKIKPLTDSLMKEHAAWAPALIEKVQAVK
jgi:tripartite ATP-independent transporter DctP family solute receptor